MQKKPLPTDFKVLVAMAAMLIIPFALTLRTITQARPLVTDLAPNPSPYGYTWSLSLFIVPVAVLATWVSARKQNPLQKKAFWITALLLTFGGVFLDVFFGLSFFTFVNHEATLGANFWGYSFAHGWQKIIPLRKSVSIRSAPSRSCWHMCGAMNSGLALTTSTMPRGAARGSGTRFAFTPARPFSA